MPRRKKPLYCSFCRRDHTVVDKLIGGPGVFICDACVARCNRILDGDHRTDFPGWDASRDAKVVGMRQPVSGSVPWVADSTIPPDSTSPPAPGEDASAPASPGGSDGRSDGLLEAADGGGEPGSGQASSVTRTL